jgi:hypothetical protein
MVPFCEKDEEHWRFLRLGNHGVYGRLCNFLFSSHYIGGKHDSSKTWIAIVRFKTMAYGVPISGLRSKCKMFSEASIEVSNLLQTMGGGWVYTWCSEIVKKILLVYVPNASASLVIHVGLPHPKAK